MRISIILAIFAIIYAINAVPIADDGEAVPIQEGMTMFEALKISILKKSQLAFQLLQLTMNQIETLEVSDVLSMRISAILIAYQLVDAVAIVEIL